MLASAREYRIYRKQTAASAALQHDPARRAAADAQPVAGLVFAEHSLRLFLAGHEGCAACQVIQRTAHLRAVVVGEIVDLRPVTEVPDGG